MKSFYLLLFTGIVTFSSIGCRKGADDPFISLKSRNARITGKWKLEEVNVINTTLNYGFDKNGVWMSSETKYIVTYDGNNLNTRITDSSNGIITRDIFMSFGYAFSLELKNNGESRYTEALNLNQNSTFANKELRQGDGQWYWANGKVRKDAFFDSGAEVSLFGTLGNQIYIKKYPLDRLTDNEMIIKNTTNRMQTDSNSTGNGTTSITTDLTLVFSKIK